MRKINVSEIKRKEQIKDLKAFAILLVKLFLALSIISIIENL